MFDFSIEERAQKLGHYIVDTRDTVRGAAKKIRRKQKHGTQGRYLAA